MAKLLLVTLGIAGAAAIAALGYHFDPGAGYRWWPPCGFQRLTGYHCPGCGGTRAVHALLHGRFGESFYYNPLVLPMLVIALSAGARWAWLARVRARPNTPPNTPPAPPSNANVFLVAFGLLAGLLAFWVLRNLPGYPLLQPPRHEFPARFR